MKKWDLYFLGMAEYISTKSKDPSTQCGAVIVRPDHTRAGDGYNGFPMQMPDAVELYRDREEKLSRIIHAEINALIFTREPVKGYTVYTYPFMPCHTCAGMLIQAGISKFVFPVVPADKADRWAASFSKTLQFFNECQVMWHEYDLDTEMTVLEDEHVIPQRNAVHFIKAWPGEGWDG